MIVSEEEAMERVNSPNNLTAKLFEIRNLHNRTGPRGIPPMVQTLVGVSAQLTTQREAGEAFGVSREQAREYEHGRTKATEDTVKKAVSTVHERALDGMLSCLELIKPKLPNVKKATELSSIASNLARVVEKTTPKDNSVSANVKVVVFAPRSKGEEEYESIAV